MNQRAQLLLIERNGALLSEPELVCELPPERRSISVGGGDADVFFHEFFGGDVTTELVLARRTEGLCLRVKDGYVALHSAGRGDVVSNGALLRTKGLLLRVDIDGAPALEHAQRIADDVIGWRLPDARDPPLDRGRYRAAFIGSRHDVAGDDDAALEAVVVDDARPLMKRFEAYGALAPRVVSTVPALVPRDNGGDLQRRDVIVRESARGATVRELCAAQKDAELDDALTLAIASVIVDAALLGEKARHTDVVVSFEGRVLVDWPDPTRDDNDSWDSRSRPLTASIHAREELKRLSWVTTKETNALLARVRDAMRDDEHPLMTAQNALREAIERTGPIDAAHVAGMVKRLFPRAWDVERTFREQLAMLDEDGRRALA